MATGISKTKWNGNHGNAPQGGDGEALDVKLTYDGKKDKAEILASAPSPLELLWKPARPAKNALYFGDNLGIMAALLPTLRGKVRLVYIDPPYATKMVFQSRRQSDAYGDLLAGAHYLEFLRERLVILRELLSEDGSIYVHLDENMAFQVKIVMDEVFGVQNFRNWITRKKCNPKNYTRKTFGNVADFILFYSKSDSYVWNRPLENWTPERIAKQYEYVDASSGRLYKKVPIHAPGERNGSTGGPWKGMTPPPGKHWQFTPAKLDEMDAKGEIYWSSNRNPRRKVFFDESEGVPIQDIWLDCRDAHNQNIRVTGYPTEKNPDLLRRIIKASSDVGDLVLDAFVGSGTTIDAASELQRAWIGIDNSPEAIVTTLRRLSHGTKVMGDFVSARLSAETMQGALEFGPRKEEPACTRQHGRITDFKLFAAAPLTATLECAVEQWRKGKMLED